MKATELTHPTHRRRLSLWGYVGVVVGAILLMSLLPGWSHLRILIWPVLNVAVSIWLFRRYKAIRVLVVAGAVFILLVVWAFKSLSGGMSILGY